LTFVNLSVTIVILEVTTLFGRLISITLCYLTLYAEANAWTTLCLALEESFVCDTVTVIIFTITRFWITRPAW
jgi:hypothetical protein